MAIPAATGERRDQYPELSQFDVHKLMLENACLLWTGALCSSIRRSIVAWRQFRRERAATARSRRPKPLELVSQGFLSTSAVGTLTASVPGVVLFPVMYHRPLHADLVIRG